MGNKESKPVNLNSNQPNKERLFFPADQDPKLTPGQRELLEVLRSNGNKVDHGRIVIRGRSMGSNH